jgi:hypothetical protein
MPMTDFRSLCAELADELQDYIDCAPVGPCDEEQALVDRARAALAQPEPEVLARVEFGDTEFNCPSDVVLSQYCDDWFFGNPRDEVDPVDLCRGAIKLFAQMPTPIPVEERLPGPEECDANGFCWFWDLEWSRWQPGQQDQSCTHWLPAHALPVPAPSREENLDA